MGSRRKARECALQMLFAADFAEAVPEEVLKTYWVELGDSDVEETAREFATRLAAGTFARRTLAYPAHGDRRSQYPSPRSLRISIRTYSSHCRHQRSPRNRSTFFN